MTTLNGYVDWATRVNARQDKVYPDRNRGLGIAWHSQEGNGLEAMKSIHAADKPPSFMFWLAKTGELYQFSPVTASTWTSGSYEANVRFWSVELEGKADQPINEAQRFSALRLMAEWAAYTGRRIVRGATETAERTMWEHREVATRWPNNAGPTSCPSERYAPLWQTMETPMPDDRTQSFLEELNAAIVKRLELLHLATATDDAGYARMLQAHAALKAAGII